MISEVRLGPCCALRLELSGGVMCITASGYESPGDFSKPVAQHVGPEEAQRLADQLAAFAASMRRQRAALEAE